MKKVTKAIKNYSQLNDEEKQEFLEFFKQEEETKKEEPKVEEPKKEEVKVEPVVEPKKEEPKKEFDFDGFMARYNEEMKVVVKELKTLKETNKETIGIKAKPKESKGENSFDDVFARLQSK
jgi:hypothetical protein